MSPEVTEFLTETMLVISNLLGLFVLFFRKKREQRARDLAEQARREKQAEEGKKRTRTVVEGLPYSPLFQSYRDQ